MQREQLPIEAGEFAAYFEDLLSRLDQQAGWCGVFWQRDPDGMTACLDGLEVPPWDVVQALLHDLAADHGTEAADREAALARPLHREALAAHDALPGARRLLVERLDLMLAEQRYAIERQDLLAGRLSDGPDPHEAENIRLDLAWARDDEERAQARSAELRARIALLGETEGAVRDRDAQARPAATASRNKRPRGARYAWAEPEEAEPEEAVPARVPAAVSSSTAPRGARYAGAAHAPVREPEPGPGADPQPAVEPVAADDSDALAEHAAAQAVRELLRLRGEGRSGEAHALLCEAVRWPAPRLPLLADALGRAGLAADWGTLLWESASLPVERLVAAADALAAAGRADDGGQLLRQGVARPAPEIADALLALREAGREREVTTLLDAYVRVRRPQEAAECALRDPARLAPLLLDAARTVSPEREWDVVHALRVAGIAV